MIDTLRNLFMFMASSGRDSKECDLGRRRAPQACLKENSGGLGHKEHKVLPNTKRGLSMFIYHHSFLVAS